MDFSSENELTSQYLWNISKRLSETCPAASRFYMCNMERKLVGDSSSLKTSVKRRYLYCSHCGSMWNAGNHQVRVKPPSLCSRVRNMLKRRKKDPEILNRKQMKNINKFNKQTNKIVYTCFVCKKNTEFPDTVKLKPSRRVEQFLPITPVPKIKCKKRDLNAGLFVTTPDNSKDERVSHCHDDSINLSGILTESETLVKVTESEDVNNSRSSEKSNRTFSTPGCANWLPAKHSTPYSSPSTTAHSKKNSLSKRKSLIAQLLNEGPKAKKKSSISSFLVNL